MLALLLAGGLSLLSLAISFRSYLHCRRLIAAAATATEDDELELRLAARERALEFGLAVRSVQVLGRASLFGGTGAAVWQLSGGSSQYVAAGVAFGLGCVGWAGCGELQRRIGLLAGRLPAGNRRQAELAARRASSARAERARTEVDPPPGSG